MKIELNEKEVAQLIDEYESIMDDDSYIFHLANYFMKQLKKQFPHLFKKIINTK